MTPTLQEFHRDSIHLRVLHFEVEDDILIRFVILVTDGEETITEFGAIQIDLGLLDTVPRCQVMEGYLPFGGILGAYDIPHESHPSAFFHVEADEFIRDAFEMQTAMTVYGRCNTISLPTGDPLAHVVEIVPPRSSDNGGHHDRKP